MKSILMIVMLVPAFAFSADKVIETLKAENSMLKKRIMQNNKMIKLRSKSSYKLKNTGSDKVSDIGSKLSLGFEVINWSSDINEAVPTFAYSYKFQNNVSLGGSYGQLSQANFPNTGNVTDIGVEQLFISYSINITETFKFEPIVGYVRYTANPLDNNFPSGATANEFNLEIEDIENRSGSFAGIALVKDFYSRWSTTFRADLSKSVSLFLGYRL